MSIAGLGSPYWYEWEIGIIECLKMMSDNTIKSVVLQSSEFQTLDDVVINYEDQSIVNIQVKHTDVGDNFTYSFLSARTDSLLKTLAEEWRIENGSKSIREIQLVTNKKWGEKKSDGKCSIKDFITKVYPKLKQDYSYKGEDESEQKAIEWFKNEICFLGTEAKKFVEIFSFRAEENLEGTEKKIKLQIAEIIGIQKEEAIKTCIDKIFSNLRIWVTSLRGERTEIRKEDIYTLLCMPAPNIPEYELYPEKPIFPSRVKFAKEFMERLVKCDNNMIFLQGFPGSGKTNFVSYLAQLDNSIIDFRYYTYLPVGKGNVSYSDDEGYYLGRMLWLSILTQLRNKFEEMNILSEIKYPMVFQYLSVSEMRQYVIKYLPVYAEKKERTCYFFIDGIDHAARSNDDRNSFLTQLPRPEEIGNGIKFILVGQPINDRYPTWLIKNKKIDYIFMPMLEVEDIIDLLEQNNLTTSNIDTTSLADTIISVVGNNALNVLFAIMELKKSDQPLIFEEIEYRLKERCLDNQIDKYYEWIINSINKNILFYKIEAIFAYASRIINRSELSEICSCTEEELLTVLNELSPLILCGEEGYFAFHNDVRLHFQNNIKVYSNYSFIVEKIKENVISQEQLEKYKYDIVFNLLYNLDDVEKIFDFMNVEYVMNAVAYSISYDYLVKQFNNMLGLLIKERAYNFLIKASVISLTLSQFANCIRYYQKENMFIEDMMSSKKTKSEKYVLDNENDIETVVNDIHILITANQQERSKLLFDEYLSEKNMQDILNIQSDSRAFFNKIGYIFRIHNSCILDDEYDINNNYVKFIDGWLEASSKFISAEDIRRTFTFKVFNQKNLKKYIENICKNKGIDEDGYNLLKRGLLNKDMPLSIIIDLCVCGIISEYVDKEIVEYINDNIEKIEQDNTVEYDKDRFVVFIKAWFCIYPIANMKVINKVYEKILLQSRIKDTTRGYKPAMAQKDMARNIFDLYYGDFAKLELKKDTIYNFMYFGDRYGAGSIFDCNANEVIRFLRKIFVLCAIKTPKSFNVTKVIDFILQCLEGEKPRYINEFNELFLVTNSKNQFMDLAEYWCGNQGKGWSQEYSEVEHCCEGIIEMLKFFGESEEASKIMERKNLKLFGYVGRKDYSLIDLLAYYKCIPISSNKLLDDGMLLLEVSDVASDIGDNRISRDINIELFDLAVKLGCSYANAIFEFKNTPDDLVYWRTTLLEAFFENIDQFDTDDELMALHDIVNAWINARIEIDRQYGRLDTLKEYNSIIYQKISSQKVRQKVQAKGNCDFIKPKYQSSTTITYDFDKIYKSLESDGYTSFFEDQINLKIDIEDRGILTLLSRLKEKIPEEKLEIFSNTCILKYILENSQYGFSHNGTRELLEIYAKYFDEESWNSILESIVNRVISSNNDTFCSSGSDICIFTLYFLRCHSPANIREAFRELCSMHMMFITAKENLVYDRYELNIDSNISTIKDLVEFQIGNIGKE